MRQSARPARGGQRLGIACCGLQLPNAPGSEVHVTKYRFVVIAFSLLVLACGSAGEAHVPLQSGAMSQPTAAGSGAAAAPAVPMVAEAASATAAPLEATGPLVLQPTAAPVSAQAVPAQTAPAPVPNAAVAPAAAARKPFAPFAGDDVVSWTTGKYRMEAGTERYLCFASNLDQDVVVNGYANDTQPLVHHLVFARVNGAQPEPEGLSECPTSFHGNWEQLYVSGAGTNTLEFPADAGHILMKGQQVVAQLHLLNVTDHAVESTLTIQMRRAKVANPRPVSLYMLGTSAVDLPAHAVSQVVSNCSMWLPITLIAGFPHMHQLGTGLRVEVGPSAAKLREVYKRDPYDYHDQHIDKLELTLAPGDMTRVTCTFNNTSDRTVSYGETNDMEMCYFFGFAIDLPLESSCLEKDPNFAAFGG
jgi:hypothetical protein